MNLSDIIDPARRAVSEDAAIEAGQHTAWLRAAYAYADADVDAHAYAGAYVDAGAYVGAYVDAHTYIDAYVDAHAYVDAYIDAYAYSGAYVDAYIDAYVDVDAYADAYVDVDVDADVDADLAKSSTGGFHMREGLYLVTTPSGNSVAVLRAGWLRRVEGDEYELHGARTPLRGDYSVTFDQAQDTPPQTWRWTEPLKRPLQLHRFQIRAPVELDAKGYAKLFPRPKGFK